MGASVRTVGRLVFVSIIASIVIGYLPSSVLANTQAGRYHDGQVDNGTKATMHGDSNLGGTNAFMLSSVRNQRVFVSNSGLYQFGWIKTGSNVNLDNCISGAYSGGFVERRVNDLSDPNGAPYLCNTYPGIGNYGDVYRFTIKHVSDGWEAIKQNGSVVEGPFSLSFNESYSMVVSEKNNTVNSMSMTFGPNGGTVWQRFEESTGNWAIVGNSAPDFYDAAGWTIGAMPCPFAVSR